MKRMWDKILLGEGDVDSGFLASCSPVRKFSRSCYLAVAAVVVVVAAGVR